MHNDQSESTQKSTPADLDSLDKTQPSAPGQRLSYNKEEPPGQKPGNRQKSPTVRERSYSYFSDGTDAGNEDTRQMGEDEKENLSSHDAPSEPFLSFGDGYEQNNNSAPAAKPAKRKAEVSPEQDDMLGTLYLGKYQLVSIIGAGGFGVIYLAHQVFLDRLVAIKMLKSNLASAKARIRFHQEGKASSALHHPAIVAINDFGIDDLDRPYMVMEYVEGVTLSDVIRERITLNVAEALPIFLELLDGLAAAHSKGIVHRDIKPGNIMLAMGEDGVHVKLLDFGIAKLLDEDDHTVQSLTKTGEALGTPLYMSPEQIQSFKIDYRSDLYSLGCVMFSCLTGAPPFVGEQKFMTMDKHLTEKPLSLKEASLGLDFPPELEAVVAKLLAKSPADRYQSADEVRSILINLSQKLGLSPGGATQAFNATGSGGSGRAINLPSSVVSIVSASQGAKTEVDSPSSYLSGKSQPTQHLTREERTRAYTINNSPAANIDAQTEVDLASAGRKPQHVTQNQSGVLSQKTGALTGRNQPIDHSVDTDEEDDEDSEPSRPYLKIAVISLMVLALVGGLSTAGYFLLKPKVVKPAPPVVRVAVPVTLPADMPLSTTPPQVRTEPLLPDGSDDETVISALSRSPHLEDFKAGDNRDITDKVMPIIGGLADLKVLSLDSTKITNEGLKYLAKSPVSILSLKHTKIDSDGVKYIVALKKLEQLFVADTGIGDEAMPLLGGKCLVTLQLSKTPVTVSGIKALAQAKNITVSLRSLILEDCAVGNDVIPLLKPFTKLTGLNLDSTKVDSKGFADLVNLKTVNSLSLAGNKQISDYDMPALSKMQQLTTLDLSGTKVTPAGLRQLKNLKNLKHLWLCGINLDDYANQAISAFKKELPECTVETINRPRSFW